MALDVTLDKTLPHSLEAERSVLGAIIIDNGAMHSAQQTLIAEDFYRDSHRRIYAALENLSTRGAAIDLVTLNEELDRSGETETVGGIAYVSALVDGVPRTANIDHYVRIVKEKSALRRLIEAAGHIVRNAYSSSDECDDIIHDAERMIFQVAQGQLRTGLQPLSALSEPVLKSLVELSERKELITGISTGFQRLDELTSGLQRGELIIIAARPAMGKTSFCLNIAQHAGLRRDARVGIFSLEMSKEQLIQRLLCSEARVDAHLLRTGRLKKPDWTKLFLAYETLNEVPIFIDDTAGMGIMEMRGKAMRMKAELGLDLVMVDYMQLMRGRGRYNSRQEEISDISRSLKELAKELDVPVIAVSQLSRAPEQRGGDHRKPQLSDLRESGAIEQDADVVLFIYRQELYQPADDNRGIAEVIIGKQRNGPTDNLNLAFIKEYTRFENLEWRSE